MTQKYAAVIFAAVAFAATVPAYGRQDRRADASRSVALRLRPDTLALFINNVAGLRVRLVSGVVDEISSPRVFTLKNERSAYPHRPNEVAIRHRQRFCSRRGTSSRHRHCAYAAGGGVGS